MRPDSWRRIGALGLPYAIGLTVVALAVFGELGQRSTADFSAPGAEELAPCHGAPPADGAVGLDPVCRMRVGATIAARGPTGLQYFCTTRCRDLFLEDPARFLGESCVVCRASGEFVAPQSGVVAEWHGTEYRFCTTEHRTAFRADPGGYFLHTMWGIPGWLYYASIAVVLLLSFIVLERAGGAGRKTPWRVDLLRFRLFRVLFVHRGPRIAIQVLTAVLFLVIIGAGLFGNQLPSKNLAPILTWTIWWGGLVLVLLYFGKAFCWVCPWDALAGWLERAGGLGLGLPVPRWLRSVWPATVLFVFLTWIELGLGVTLKPRATAYLALGILGLAIGCALIFERRAFCRYACLVGRISGLYALFSPVEVRSRDESVCRTCTTHSCFKGNAAGRGCPTAQFPGTMPNNTYCTMCMECLRTCEPGNMTLSVRPWGEDLRAVRRPRADEAFLALILLALTGFHGLTMTGSWRSLVAWLGETFGLSESVGFSAGMVLLLAAPIAAYALLVAATCFLAGERRPSFRDTFVRYSYSILPIAFFYHIAHNAEHLLMEGQRVLSLVSDPLGREWDLFGTSHVEFAPVVGLGTLWGIQVFLVLVGHVFGIWAAHHASAPLWRDGRPPWRSQLPMLGAMVLFSIFSLWLLKQPMEMRTSAM